MKLTLNGEAHEATGTPTLQQLLDSITPGDGRVAVVVNDSVVPASERVGFALKENDRIEILTFAGGG